MNWINFGEHLFFVIIIMIYTTVFYFGGVDFFWSVFGDIIDFLVEAAEWGIIIGAVILGIYLA